MTIEDSGRYYEGLGDTFEHALQRAHDQIPPREGRDFAVSRVIDMGMQRGGFTRARKVWVRVIELEDARFKTDK